MKAAIDRDDLDVTEDTVLILRNAGPQGGPGMPEWGMLPIPKKLVKQGVRDMVRHVGQPACPAPATAPASCTSRRNPTSAGRWRC